MQNQQSLPSMIFIKFALHEVGENCLISKYKANHFFHVSDLGPQEFIRLFTIVQGIPNPQDPKLILPGDNAFPSDKGKNSYCISKYNLLLVIIYNIYNEPSLNGKASEYYMKYYQDVNIIPIRKEHDKMMLLFNLIEFEFKYHIRNKQELRVLYDELQFFENTPKSSEDELLFCYYIAVISFLLTDYQKTEDYSSKFIIKMSELYGLKKDEQIDVIRYLSIQNKILKIHSLEEKGEEHNRIEIIGYLETLLQETRVQKEELAIKIGLKMYTLQAKLGEYKKCIETLKILAEILKTEMLQGKSHRALVEQLLYISGLLGYYHTLLGNNNQVQKYSKKIIKALNILKTMMSATNQESKDLIPRYGFYSVVLDKLSKGGKNSEKEVRESIRMYQDTKLVNCNEDEILNIYFMNTDQTNEKAFQKAYLVYEDILNNRSPLEDHQLFTFYIYHYNYLSLLHSIISQTNVSKIRDISEKLIDYTNHYIIEEKADYLKKLFQLDYLKILLINVYTILISTYYFEKNYAEVIVQGDNFLQLVKFQYELDNNDYSTILKLKGDALFKLNKQNESFDIYKEAKNMTSNPDIKRSLLCNMAVSILFCGKQKNVSIELLDQALEYAKDDESGTKLTIESMIKKISNI